MTRLWLVRHGPTHSKAFTGWRDIPADLSDLAALGRLDAYLPADALLVSSDLVRAAATADALQGHRNRLPHSPGLREFNHGVWDGLTFDEVIAGWPEQSREYWERPGHISPPGGESWIEGAARMSAATDALIAAHAGRDLVIVAHFGTILTQLARATGLSPYDTLSQPIDNLSVTCLIHDKGWSAGPINHRP